MKKILIFPLIFVIVALISYFVLSNTGKNPITLDPNATPAPTPKEKTSYNIALLGHGGSGHEGGGLADSIIILNIDIKTKKASFISIPRDTFISGQKVNYQFATGGGIAIKQALQTITGLEMDYFVSIDFSGFENAIDALGGISVNVPVSFTDEFYPIKGEENNLCGKSLEEVETLKATLSAQILERQFTCRYEKLQFNQGITQMDGKTALKFVRSRHSAQHGGDFARSQRQIAVLNAIKDKALSMEALDNIPQFFNQFAKFIRADLDANVITLLYKMIGDPQNYTEQSINLSTDNVFKESISGNGAYILVPQAGEGNWGPVQDYIKNELN